jgi:hypothetical protein
MPDLPDCLQKILDYQGKLKRGCVFFNLIESYNKVQVKYQQASPKAKIALRKSLNVLGQKILELSKELECFPEMCVDCPGQKKCQNCKDKKKCSSLLTETQTQIKL